MRALLSQSSGAEGACLGALYDVIMVAGEVDGDGVGVRAGAGIGMLEGAGLELGAGGEAEVVEGLEWVAVRPLEEGAPGQVAGEVAGDEHGPSTAAGGETVMHVHLNTFAAGAPAAQTQKLNH